MYFWLPLYASSYKDNQHNKSKWAFEMQSVIVSWKQNISHPNLVVPCFAVTVSTRPYVQTTLDANCTVSSSSSGNVFLNSIQSDILPNHRVCRKKKRREGVNFNKYFFSIDHLLIYLNRAQLVYSCTSIPVLLSLWNR